MDTFFRIGQTFISALGEIGNYLLLEPFTAFEIVDKMGWLLDDSTKELLLQNPEMTLNISIGEVLIGSSLVMLLGFRLIKFFVDLIT